MITLRFFFNRGSQDVKQFWPMFRSVWTKSQDMKSTVDQEEIAKFQSIGEKWWSGKEYFGLHQMNELRVPLIRDRLQSHKHKHSSKPLTGIKILDVGCGGGILTEPLARLGADVTGIDPCQENVDVALEHSKLDDSLLGKLNYEKSLVEEFSGRNENSEKFDAIIASEVLEHVDDVNLFVGSALKCLKSGGKFFITTINQNLISYLGAIFLAEYIFGLLPKGTHSYEKFVSPNALQMLLQENGCHVTLTQGMVFNPITRRWSWSQNTCINYAIEAVKH